MIAFARGSLEKLNANDVLANVYRFDCMFTLPHQKAYTET